MFGLNIFQSPRITARMIETVGLIKTAKLVESVVIMARRYQIFQTINSLNLIRINKRIVPTRTMMMIGM